MKTQTTRKAIKANYYNIIEIGYCDLQSLLAYRQPDFYTAGIYGWNANIFEIDYKTVIVTGYRPFGNIRPEYKLVREYDGQAREIQNDWTAKDNKEKVEALLAEFLEKVLSEKN